MGGVRDEAVLLFERSMKSAQHLVDGVAEVFDLVFRAGEIQTLVEVLLGDRSRQCGDPGDAAEGLARDEPYRDAGEQNCRRDDREQHHGVGKVFGDTEHDGLAVEVSGVLALRRAAGGGLDAHFDYVLQQEVLRDQQDRRCQREGSRGQHRESKREGTAARMRSLRRRHGCPIR